MKMNRYFTNRLQFFQNIIFPSSIFTGIYNIFLKKKLDNTIVFICLYGVLFLIFLSFFSIRNIIKKLIKKEQF